MLVALVTGLAVAQAPLETSVAGGDPVVEPREPEPGDEVQLLGLFQTRLTTTSVETTSPYLDGQVIGTLGGTNGTVVEGNRGTFAEQRAVGFGTWRPAVLDGRASLTAAFEIDFVLGDQSYGVGGNAGGGFGADQVNLQTRRLHANFNHTAGGWDLSAVLGLQFLSDTVYDPRTAHPDDLFRTGGGLKIWGSEAAGLSLFGVLDGPSGELLRARLGAYTLVEQGVSLDDDISLVVGDAQWVPDAGWRVGAHAWWLRDRSEGQGTVFGTGPFSALSGLQGAPQLSVTLDDGSTASTLGSDLLWLALDGGYNHRLDRGPLGFSALVLANVGRLYVNDAEDPAVRGVLVSGDVRYRYAPGSGSVVRAEALFSSGDAPGGDYGGVITGNSYGFVGASWTTHGSVLLLPDPGAINRQVAVAYDVSGGGAGLLAISGGAGFDVQPDRVTVSANVAHARLGTGDVLGTELTGRLQWQPLPLCRVGLTGAAVVGSAFESLPWTAFASVDWVLF